MDSPNRFKMATLIRRAADVEKFSQQRLPENMNGWSLLLHLQTALSEEKSHLIA